MESQVSQLEFLILFPYSAELVEDVDLLIRRAERCLEAGADMIMIDADGICRQADSVRADIVAKVVGRLGLEKTMFETSNPKTSEWFIKQYGPRVSFFVHVFHFALNLKLQKSLVSFFGHFFHFSLNSKLRKSSKFCFFYVSR